MLEAAGAPNVVEGKDYPELLALLNRGIVDGVVAPESVLRSLDAKAGEAPRVTLMDEGYDFYTAGGPAMTEDTAQRVRAAYKALVESGVVGQLKKAHPDITFAD